MSRVNDVFLKLTVDFAFISPKGQVELMNEITRSKGWE